VELRTIRRREKKYYFTFFAWGTGGTNPLDHPWGTVIARRSVGINSTRVHHPLYVHQPSPWSQARNILWLSGRDATGTTLSVMSENLTPMKDGGFQVIPDIKTFCSMKQCLQYGYCADVSVMRGIFRQSSGIPASSK
jgi:hypothetical protein